MLNQMLKWVRIVFIGRLELPLFYEPDDGKAHEAHADQRQNDGHMHAGLERQSGLASDPVRQHRPQKQRPQIDWKTERTLFGRLLRENIGARYGADQSDPEGHPRPVEECIDAGRPPRQPVETEEFH